MPKPDHDRMREAVSPAHLWPATIAAVVLLAATGFGSRALNQALNARPAHAGQVNAALGRVPLVIGDWHGRDINVEQSVRAATDTDDLLNREYIRGNGLDTVGLYVAYGVRVRDMMPHRPEVCYVGGGWTRERVEQMELPLSDGRTLPCRLLHFSRGGFDSRLLVVLNYYIADGVFYTDVDSLRLRAWRGSRSFRYLLQVQIVSSTSEFRDADDAVQLVRTFAAKSVEHLRAILPSLKPAETAPGTSAAGATDGEQP